jgi:hypothetical protein
MSRSQALRVRLTWRLGIAGSPSNSVLRLLLVPVEASSLVPPFLVSPCRLWGCRSAWQPGVLSLVSFLCLPPCMGAAALHAGFSMPCLRGWLSGSSAVPATRGVQQHGWGVRGSGLRRRWGALPLAMLHGRRLMHGQCPRRGSLLLCQHLWGPACQRCGRSGVAAGFWGLRGVAGQQLAGGWFGARPCSPVWPPTSRGVAS